MLLAEQYLQVVDSHMFVYLSEFDNSSKVNTKFPQPRPHTLGPLLTEFRFQAAFVLKLVVQETYKLNIRVMSDQYD